MTDIKVFDNFFDKNIFLDTTSKIYNGSWLFGSSSNRDQYTNGDIVEERINGNYLNPNSKSSIFWNMDLSNDDYFKNILFDVVKEKIGIDCHSDFIYANGQTYGQGGDFHIDDSDGFTFLLYCNRIWRPEWGGKTAFIHPDKSSKYIDPIPNRVVIFPGSILHRSEEVSRNFTGLRITLVYKLKL